MKKKIFLCLLVICAFLCLTSCDTNEETSDVLLTALQEEKIVDADLILVDKVSKIGTTLFYSQTTYYIYKDCDNKLIAINYDTNISSQNEYDYSVEVYYNVSVDNDVEYLNDDTTPESYYSYQDGKKSEYNKYNLENKTDYLVYESKPLFSKTKYTIKKAN
ncbi:MAG: hypothetical protein IKJ80_06890 [Clostridia bacterium]|nr:hypothetical protein [Clostridia bacterium]